MKSMKINIKDTEKINAALEAAEKGNSARLFETSRIQPGIEAAEERLAALGLLKKYWAGASIEFLPAGVPNSYNKGFRAAAKGTYVTITRFSGGWYMTQISRFEVPRKAYGGREKAVLRLTAEQINEIPRSHEL